MEVATLAILLEKFKHLSYLEILVIGIAIGSTQLPPDLIFRFFSQSSQLPSIDQKTQFYSYILQGSLGEAKSILKAANIPKKKFNLSICKICKLCIPSKEITKLTNCFDCFHSNCLRINLENQILSKTSLIKCPECYKVLTNQEISSIVNKSCMFSDKVPKSAGLNVIECPIPNCYNQISAKPDTIIAVCSKCKTRVCISCKSKFHDNKTCAEYSQNKHLVGNCPHCHREVAFEGKKMVFCTCKTQFCVKCLKTPIFCQCSP